MVSYCRRRQPRHLRGQKAPRRPQNRDRRQTPAKDLGHYLVPIPLRGPFQRVLCSLPSWGTHTSQASATPRWPLEAETLPAGEQVCTPPKVTGQRSHFQDASLFYLFARQIFGEVGLRIASRLPVPWEMVHILRIVAGL